MTTDSQTFRCDARGAFQCCVFLLAVFGIFLPGRAQDATKQGAVTIDWNKTVLVSQSTATLQVVVNPMLRRGSPIHDASFDAVKQFGGDYVRYVPWLPYPRLAVAELKAPTAVSTSWDFTSIDPMTKDFMEATKGHTTVMNFSTMPAWLFKTEKPVTYPDDPYEVNWDYTQGTELRDPTGKELGNYYARLVSWYTRGGFTDESGKIHTSGYHYTFPIWEVLNEVDFEHKTTPEQYTQRYDAIVHAIQQVSPTTKFMGVALAMPSDNPKWFEYFLNHNNHKLGIPLDYISYHFYATPSKEQTINDWQYSFFNEADRFLTTAMYINEIRTRLSPATKIDADEIGVILWNDNNQVPDKSGHIAQIPPEYWNAAGALYAYVYIGLAKQGIDVIGESQMVGYPTQFPSVSMIDWTNGKPNARYWVLKLIKDNFHPGDKIVETKLKDADGVTAQAFLTPMGKKLLVLNQRDRRTEVELPEDMGTAKISTVDLASGEGPAVETTGHGKRLKLAPFAVTVVSWR